MQIGYFITVNYSANTVLFDHICFHLWQHERAARPHLGQWISCWANIEKSLKMSKNTHILHHTENFIF